MEKLPRQQAPTTGLNSPLFSNANPLPHELNHEPIYQYERELPYKPNQIPTLPTYTRQFLTQMMWPRLLVLRVHHVLSASFTLMNFAPDGNCWVILDDIGLILTPLGWMLHGVRMLINTLELLQKLTYYGLKTQASKPDPTNDTHSMITDHVNQVINDLIWMFSVLAPNTLEYTTALLIIDVICVVSRAYFTIQAIQSKNTEEKNIDLEQMKLALNLVNLLSISAISILKNFVLPSVSPMLAVNPWLLLSFSLLSLVITIASHVLGKALAKQTLDNEHKQIDRASLSVVKMPHRSLSFFSKSALLNEEKSLQPFNAICA